VRPLANCSNALLKNKPFKYSMRYPPVEPAELARHAAEVGRLLQDAGLASGDVLPHWSPPTRLSFAWLSSRTKACGYQHLRWLVLIVRASGYEEDLFAYLLHIAWLLAFGPGYQDAAVRYWAEPRLPCHDCLGYELAEATLAELLGLSHLEELVQLLRGTT
jgi:hypothetical protein